MKDEADYLARLARWRRERDDFFAHHYATPLSDDDLTRFTGLRYFPPDSGWMFVVLMERDEASVEIQSSTGMTSVYPGAGLVTVPFSTGAVRMRVLRGEEDELFVPFRDVTSGATTYSGGRYVTAQADAQGMLTIDFNKSTNPYCAYDPEFSCPLPPRQNWLSFAVEAGELDYV